MQAPAKLLAAIMLLAVAAPGAYAHEFAPTASAVAEITWYLAPFIGFGSLWALAALRPGGFIRRKKSARAKSKEL